MSANLILAIESSCDETAICILKDGTEVLANVIASQIPIHQKFGGVVPEIASRQHVDAIALVLDEALQQANVSLSDISAIGVTYGPGLVGGLLVGLTFAKGLAFALDKPLIGVNHLEGHFYANYLCHPQLKPPFIALVVSGGHTSLLHVQDYQNFSVLGQTQDDAAGEAFDKIARVLGLGYPGGPLIDKLAKEGDANKIVFPKAKLKGRYDFSFSGLKSAVINYLHNAKQKDIQVDSKDVCAGFQKTIVDSLSEKALLALHDYNLDTLVLAGGVSANTALRTNLTELLGAEGKKLYYPDAIFCTDNAGMIAMRAYYLYLSGYRSDFTLNADPALKI